uniref:Uncharacterized protein n=1 Tax=Chromera velia CCMP2878 TaxID=1169474 RepID=A0A0G4I939_9ALVE|eukprot:Cvel_12147.t1-p1 / transcript=Cvel_12147.t1 / gene=Cvel_12147 / organism=Chromera_velia_CCMP2878 / gene_product=hypothetical protein / transcript_product=hypothetical protein / location=Cvel_scaffold783:19788-21858(-) / protein_length=364 / sequence_SO=supercontig / SO=protein_coding / is_pseudo=false
MPNLTKREAQYVRVHPHTVAKQCEFLEREMMPRHVLSHDEVIDEEVIKETAKFVDGGLKNVKDYVRVKEGRGGRAGRRVGRGETAAEDSGPIERKLVPEGESDGELLPSGEEEDDGEDEDEESEAPVGSQLLFVSVHEDIEGEEEDLLALVSDHMGCLYTDPPTSSEVSIVVNSKKSSKKKKKQKVKVRITPAKDEILGQEFPMEMGSIPSATLSLANVYVGRVEFLPDWEAVAEDKFLRQAQKEKGKETEDSLCIEENPMGIPDALVPLHKPKWVGQGNFTSMQPPPLPIGVSAHEEAEEEEKEAEGGREKTKEKKTKKSKKEKEKEKEQSSSSRSESRPSSSRQPPREGEESPPPSRKKKSK